MSDTEKLMELARMVSDMLKAQQYYFRTRTNDALQASKAREAKVKRYCEEVLPYDVPCVFDLPPAIPDFAGAQ
jgi:hypothetical protein